MLVLRQRFLLHARHQVRTTKRLNASTVLQGAVGNLLWDARETKFRRTAKLRTTPPGMPISSAKPAHQFDHGCGPKPAIIRELQNILEIPGPNKS